MYTKDYKERIEAVAYNSTIKNFMIEYFEATGCETDNIGWKSFYDMINEKQIPLKDAYECSKALRRLMANNYNNIEFRGEKNFNIKFFYKNYDFENEVLNIVTEEEWDEFCTSIESYILRKKDYIAAWVLYIYRQLLWRGETNKAIDNIKRQDVKKLDNGISLLGHEFYGQFWNESFEFVEFRFEQSPSRILIPTISKAQKQHLEKNGVAGRVLYENNNNIRKSGMLWRYFKDPQGDVTLFQQMYLDKVREYFLE